jgi:hypothetical protein
MHSDWWNILSRERTIDCFDVGVCLKCPLRNPGYGVRYVTDRVARRVLPDARASIERIVAIPPGNMRVDKRDPALP